MCTPSPLPRGGLLLLVVSLALVAGCGRQDSSPFPPPHRGPILLVTYDGLRADVVGGVGGIEGLTPHLDALAHEATWAGRAVSTSSWTVPAMASLFTGLQPWAHQAIHAGQARLRRELHTLGEALGELGLDTHAYRSNHWLSGEYGYAQGFEHFRRLGQAKWARGHLESLDDRPAFLWVHILPPHAPYLRREPLLPRLEAVLERLPPELPERVGPGDLEPFYDPATPWPVATREQYWALYCLNVLWADNLLGELLAALARSGQLERTLLVVTSNHGEEFGEAGQSGHGGNLDRRLIEVPLVIKLPAGSEHRLAIAAGGTVSTARLWATLVEAVGGDPTPGVAPSLFRPAPGEALSELYLGNGVNRFSLVSGGHQLRWESRFAAAEPDYYRARRVGLGQEVSPPLAESVGSIFDRLESAFLATPPLSGGMGAPEMRLDRWTATEVEQVRDRTRLEQMARRLREVWMHGIDEELEPARLALFDPDLTPAQRRRLEELVYATDRGRPGARLEADRSDGGSWTGEGR